MFKHDNLRIIVYPLGSPLRPQGGRAFLGISLNNSLIDQPRRLHQVISWMTENIGPFDILVGDYLNRHNYQAFDGLTEDVAINRAKSDGVIAMNRLSKLLPHDFEPEGKMFSAGTLSLSDGFEGRLHKLRRVYSTNVRFKLLIEEAIEGFLRRRYPTVTPTDAIRTHCVEYQLEELALFEFLAEAGHSTFVYAGAHLPVMKGLVSGSLVGVSSALEKLILVELRLFPRSGSVK